MHSFTDIPAHPSRIKGVLALQLSSVNIAELGSLRQADIDIKVPQIFKSAQQDPSFG